MSGEGACAPVVPDPPEEAVLGCEVPGVAHPAVGEALANEAPGCVAPAEFPLAKLPLGVLPGTDDALSVVCVPLPSVPPPPLCGPVPPFSTLELAWMIAWRKGWTPSDTLAMTAIPASTAAGRSQPMFHCETGRVLPPSDGAACGIS